MALPTKGSDYAVSLDNIGLDGFQVRDNDGDVVWWLDRNGIIHNNTFQEVVGGIPIILGTMGGNPTVSHGMPCEMADYTSGNISAAISNQVLYTVPMNRDGFFRASWRAKVITPASGSSVLGGGSAFQVTYTDADDGVSLTTPSTAFSGNAGNVTTTQGSGVVMMYAKANTNITFSFGYTSSGTPMVYVLHVRLEDL